ncbi:XRE family transcriptional regulator [Polyangium fumosum]|uniref:XRE family transcriptional regulator n=1 Tax=Polyangium fumosum TaxID=889272 RepID=A0A4U1IW57_9BACT|nr:XRE family transcriptional regulator [Polyangium fumosum]
MTLEQRPERAGLTPSDIGGIEIGRRDPSLSSILALALGLGAPGQLMGGVHNLEPAAVGAAQIL